MKFVTLLIGGLIALAVWCILAEEADGGRRGRARRQARRQSTVYVMRTQAAPMQMQQMPMMQMPVSAPLPVAIPVKDVVPEPVRVKVPEKTMLVKDATAPTPTNDYTLLRAKAIAFKKPLVVWMGYKCPSSAVQVPGMLHHFANGDSWKQFRGPGVVVLVPAGDGQLYARKAISAADCCATNIKREVEQTLVSLTASRQSTVTVAAAKHIPGLDGFYKRIVRRVKVN